MAAAIVAVDSVTTLVASHAGAVVVTGSHGGVIAARYALHARVHAAVFNDAGIGLDDAGVAGLALLEEAGVAACAVSHASARIGDASDTLACGIVSRMNTLASADGVHAGMACAEAAGRMAHAVRASVTTDVADIAYIAESRTLLQPPHDSLPAVVALDSIGLVRDDDAGAILIIGSHGALHGGDPASALPVDAQAAFFHDAGRGKEDAGTSRLPALDARGIAAATVDYRSAHIGDARSMWDRGVLSCVNASLRRLGVAPGTSVRAAVERIATKALRA